MWIRVLRKFHGKRKEIPGHGFSNSRFGQAELECVCVGGGRLKSNKVEKSPFKAVYKSPTKDSSDGDLIPSWYVQVLFSDFTPGLVHTGAVRRWKVTQEGPSSPFSLCFLITM